MVKEGFFMKKIRIGSIGIGNISRGVGLPAVQYIVNEMGGTLEVQSEQGKGTVFQVTLPLDQVTGGQT